MRQIIELKQGIPTMSTFRFSNILLYSILAIVLVNLLNLSGLLHIFGETGYDLLSQLVIGF